MTAGTGSHCSVAFGSVGAAGTAGVCACANDWHAKRKTRFAAAAEVKICFMTGFLTVSIRALHRTNLERLRLRYGRIRPRRREFVRHVTRVVQVGDRGGDGAIVELLRAVDLVAARHAAGMEMADPLDVVADRADHIAFHDLHMIDVVQQLYVGRAYALHHGGTERGVVALVAGVVDLAVEQLDADRDAVLRGERS